MKFVCTSKRAIIRAAMAHMFLKRAYQQNKLNEISNMNDVLEALDPSNILDGLFVGMDEKSLEEEEISETD